MYGKADKPAEKGNVGGPQGSKSAGNKNGGNLGNA